MSSRCVRATAPGVPRQPYLGILEIVVPAHLAKTRLKEGHSANCCRNHGKGGGREAQCPQDAGLAGLFNSFRWRFQVAEMAKRSLETKTENRGIWPYTTRVSHKSYCGSGRQEGTLGCFASRGSFGSFYLRISADWIIWGGGEQSHALLLVWKIAPSPPAFSTTANADSTKAISRGDAVGFRGDEATRLIFRNRCRSLFLSTVRTTRLKKEFRPSVQFGYSWKALGENQVEARFLSRKIQNV